MGGRRFMIDRGCIAADTAYLDGDLFRHIVRVLRCSVGDSLTLVDGTGCEYEGEIATIGRDRLTVRVGRSAAMTADEAGALRITLCQALPKGEKIDLILQKGTELGVNDFWLFGGRRSVARIRGDQVDGKVQRWQRIAAEAARQCGRRTVPAVRWFPAAPDAIAASGHSLRLILREDERKNTLRTAFGGVPPRGALIVAVGPEGGFAPEEAEQFAGGGFTSVSLGSRILRTETAAIAIAAILQYISEEI